MFSLQTHRRKARKGREDVVTSSPYCRIVADDKGPVFLQDGKVWTEDGKEVDPIPDWVQTEIDKMDDAVLIEVGFVEAPEVPVPVTKKAKRPVPAPMKAKTTPKEDLSWLGDDKDANKF